jgi:hypothetical protein
METICSKTDIQIIKLRDAQSLRIYLNTKIDIDEYEKLILEAPEMLSTLIGVAKALQRVLYQYNPDSIEHEWIGEAQECIHKVTGNNLND